MRIIFFQTRLDTTGENALVQFPVSLLSMISATSSKRLGQSDAYTFRVCWHLHDPRRSGPSSRQPPPPVAMDRDAKVWWRLCIVSPLPATAFTQMRLYQFFMLMCSPRLGRKTKALGGCPEQSLLRGDDEEKGNRNPLVFPRFRRS